MCSTDVEHCMTTAGKFYNDAATTKLSNHSLSTSAMIESSLHLCVKLPLHLEASLLLLHIMALQTTGRSSYHLYQTNEVHNNYTNSLNQQSLGNTAASI